MKRLTSTFAAAGAVAILAAASASAAGNADHSGSRGGFAARRLERCLASLDLPSDLKSDIDTAIAAAKPGLQADAQTARADRVKLEADLGTGADRSVLGADVQTLHADRRKLHADATALRDTIAGKLTADQQSQVKGCFRGPRDARSNANNS